MGWGGEVVPRSTREAPRALMSSLDICLQPCDSMRHDMWFKPLAGLFNQPKMIPLQFCPLTIELELVDNATVIAGYRTYPHVDVRETGARVLAARAAKADPPLGIAADAAATDSGARPDC